MQALDFIIATPEETKAIFGEDIEIMEIEKSHLCDYCNNRYTEYGYTECRKENDNFYEAMENDTKVSECKDFDIVPDDTEYMRHLYESDFEYNVLSMGGLL